MVRIILTKNEKVLAKRIWNAVSLKRKKELLKSLGVSQTWSKAKTLEEMQNRGGSFVVKKILQLVRIFIKERSNIRKTIFK